MAPVQLVLVGALAAFLMGLTRQVRSTREHRAMQRRIAELETRLAESARPPLTRSAPPPGVLPATPPPGRPLGAGEPTERIEKAPG